MNCFACLAHRSDIQRNAQGRHPVGKLLERKRAASKKSTAFRRGFQRNTDAHAAGNFTNPFQLRHRMRKRFSPSVHPNKRRRAPGRRWAPPTPVPAHIHFRSISRSAPRAVHPGQTAHNATNRIPDGRRKRAAHGLYLPAHFFNVSHPLPINPNLRGRKKQLHIFKTNSFLPMRRYNLADNTGNAPSSWLTGCCIRPSF